MARYDLNCVESAVKLIPTYHIRGTLFQKFVYQMYIVLCTQNIIHGDKYGILKCQIYFTKSTQ